MADRTLKIGPEDLVTVTTGQGGRPNQVYDRAFGGWRRYIATEYAEIEGSEQPEAPPSTPKPTKLRRSRLHD